MAANNLAFCLAEYNPTPEDLARAQELIKPLLEAQRESRGRGHGRLDLFPIGPIRAGPRRSSLRWKAAIESTPVISYHAGMVQLKLGERAKAKEYLEKATRSQESFPGRAEAVKVLKELG